MYIPIIGLEIHVQLKTSTKMFCGCDAHIWGEPPNSHVCPVCLGLPGALPVINKKAVSQVIKMGLALNCKINQKTFFERKNYFYPDLPKGYQTSQHRQPLCVNGLLSIGGKKVGIWDVHLEEDTAKSIHIKTEASKQKQATKKEGYTLIDFNKSGIPLMEIVSAPDIRSAEEAVEYCKLIRQIVRFLEISDADIEKGQMRFEVNVSLRKLKTKNKKSKTKEKLPDYRVEIKNLNSFRFVQKAIEYEIKRQKEVLKKGGKLTWETRGFDEKREITVSQREKEQAKDYRYFPEPDLPPIEISNEEINQLKKEIPELPHQAYNRLIQTMGLNKVQAKILSREKSVLSYFDRLIQTDLEPKKAANTIINHPELISRFSPYKLVEYLKREQSGQITDEVELEKLVKKIIAENPKPVRDYLAGKTEVLHFLLGQVMKETKGKADAKIARTLLKTNLVH
ncbi:MAG: Asp-tRNA(Asn)/Glu-tRNA(Gln) amidotransferase GatCAB subunit B [Chloroflexota bacterium]|nr:MAG: Asp-tRNA(Asn)/Glu-tRNA(Gln) amidotransferase GatCAB subunit B [Chloroflexota bacterium]